jgi:hypothetical protein
MTNLWLFFLMLAKVGILTGLAPAIAIAIFCEKFRMVKVGIEKVGSPVPHQAERWEGWSTTRLKRFTSATKARIA